MMSPSIAIEMPVASSREIPGKRPSSTRISSRTSAASTSTSDAPSTRRRIAPLNTTLAKGCIIGANAVVTKDTKPMGVYGGVPAKFMWDRRDRAEKGLTG